MSKPGKIRLNGAMYACTLVKIVERDGQGRPRSLTILYDDEATTIKGGEHFLTAYIDAACLVPRKGPDADVETAVKMQKAARQPS